MEDKPKETIHPCHQAELVKLNRVIGQLEGIKRMIDDNRYCVDLLTQLKATKSAIRRIELNILSTHMKHCLTAASKSDQTQELESKIKEIINIMSTYVS